jgi:hypothetical protein
MANSFKTLKDGDIVNAALPILHNNMPFIKSISKQYDNRFAKSGAKNGGTLLIREPNQFTVRSGWTMDVQDVNESTQSYVMSTVRGVDIEFSTEDLTLSIDDFSERYLTPAMTRLAAQIEKTVLDAVYPYCGKLENTTFGTKPVLADTLAAKAFLDQGLCPPQNRYLLVDTLANNSIITDSKTIYTATSETSKQYLDGIVGRVSGFNVMQSELTPIHTCGTRTTAGTCNLAAVTNTAGAGISTLSITGTNGEIYAVGDVITVAGVYEVDPEVKTALPTLKQFTVATAYTATGSAANLTITWPLYKDGPKQNAYCADWTAATAATVVDLTDSSGTASTAYRQNLAYVKDAFVFATADLEQPKGTDMAARAVMDGISMSLVRDFDIINRSFPLRLDVLFAYKCVMPYWCVRVMS